MDAALYDRLEAVSGLADELDVPMAQYTLAWALAQPAIVSLVVGAKRAKQIEDAVVALDVSIPSEHLKKLDQICPPPWKQPDPIRG